MTGPGVDVDGGGIDMYPGGALAMMDAIVAAAAELTLGWAANIGQIAALDGQLGNGPLGRAIAADYNKAVADIREGAEKTMERVQQLGSAGTKVVRMYADTDQRTGQYYGF